MSAILATIIGLGVLPVNMTGVLTGVAMMIGAVVWFVVGLTADRISFRPPILFVLGMIAVGKGLLGRG
jgi:hypothetical protein